MPMKILRLDLGCENIRQQKGLCSGNILYGIGWYAAWRR